MKKLLVILTLIMLPFIIFAKDNVYLIADWVSGFTPEDVTVSYNTCDYTDLKVTVKIGSASTSINHMYVNRSGNPIITHWSSDKDVVNKSVCVHYYNSDGSPDTKEAALSINVTKDDTTKIHYVEDTADYISYNETISAGEGN